MENVMLKNGTEYPRIIVQAAMFSLEGLMDHGLHGHSALYELHEKAKDPNYIIQASTKILLEAGLIKEDGALDKSVRDVVLSAVRDDYSLGSPIDRGTTHQAKEGQSGKLER